jgi:hypothetical protein
MHFKNTFAVFNTEAPSCFNDANLRYQNEITVASLFAGLDEITCSVGGWLQGTDHVLVYSVVTYTFFLVQCLYFYTFICLYQFYIGFMYL